VHAFYLHGRRDLRNEQVDPPSPAADEVLVRFRAGGICGSDMHYYHYGSNSGFDLVQPLVLGHEFAGEIVDAGRHGDRLPVGSRVAVDPSRPCRQCRYCVEGTYNLCRAMRYYGSAATVPHVDGCFRELVPALAERCHLLPDSISWAEGALLEPLSIALHAASRAGDVAGRQILISGAGPIGQLLGMVTRHHGAASITVTDVRHNVLDLAADLWADDAILVGADAEMDAAAVHGGGFDVVIEASGATAALYAAYERCNPGGLILQVGNQLGDAELPVNLALVRELTVRGSFRFAHQFGRAVELLASRRIDVSPLITNSLPFSSLPDALETALGATSLKVVLEHP